MSITQKKLDKVSRAAQLLGKIKTPRKADAARRNGKLGGRKLTAAVIGMIREHDLADKARMEGSK